MVSHVMEKRLVFVVPSLFFLLSLQGCLATRGWVTEQIAPLDARVSDLDTRLGQTNARVDGLADRMDHLRLERRLVLNLKEGANFGYNSNALTPETRGE